MNSIERLKEMVNKAFLYKKKEVVILGYCDGTGEDGEDVEIYLNNGRIIEWKFSELEEKLNRFQPITNTVVNLANERLRQVSTFDPDTLKELKGILLNQIKTVKDDPTAIEQSKQVYDGVKTYTGLAKTEIDFRKYIDKHR